MFRKVCEAALLISLGAFIAQGAIAFKESDSIDRYAATVADSGDHERATTIEDIKGILGRPAAIALAMASVQGYPELRKQALELAREVVAGHQAAALAQTNFVESASRIELAEQREFIETITGLDPKAVKLGAELLVKVPDLRIRLKAATALAVIENPKTPNISQAIEIAAKQKL